MVLKFKINFIITKGIWESEINNLFRRFWIFKYKIMKRLEKVIIMTGGMKEFLLEMPKLVSVNTDTVYLL